MIFTQYWFVEFAAIVVPVYLALRWPTARYLFLLAACAVFHAHFAGAAGVLPIIALGTAVYFLARRGNATCCAAGIVLCVGTLVFYKYTEFFCNSILSLFSSRASAQMLGLYKTYNPGIPLGISFFTFEFIHYLYEVRRRRAPITNPLDFALFTIFFPSLVAGPIKRYDEFLASLKEGIRWQPRSADIAGGLLRIATGYFKKVCLADNLTVYINQYIPAFPTLPMLDKWALFLAIALRILMDFSGYSDIAIGFAQLFGIRLPENFNWPYLSTSLQAFWQRWHISLSTWLRDYVYIPLGGGRVAPLRRVANALIAFGLCGLWHGAAWNFVLWGLLHGVGLAININYRKAGLPGRMLEKLFARVPVLGWGITMLYVCMGWLLFFYPVPQAARLASGLFPANTFEIFIPEPKFDVAELNFDPAVDQSALDELHAGNIATDGWLLGKTAFRIPASAPYHKAEIEIFMPAWSDVKDSVITIRVNGRVVVEQPLQHDVSKFTLPFDDLTWQAHLGTWLHFSNRITIEATHPFLLPKPDTRAAYFCFRRVKFTE